MLERVAIFPLSLNFYYSTDVRRCKRQLIAYDWAVETRLGGRRQWGPFLFRDLPPGEQRSPLGLNRGAQVLLAPV